MKKLAPGHPRALAIALALAALQGAAACAPIQPPKELIAARESFKNAKRLAESAPTELEEARRALLAAEKRFEEVGAEPQIADLAFVVERKVEKAQSAARGVQAEKEISELATKLHAAEVARADKERAEMARLQAEHAKKEAELAAERAARAAAEAKEASALEALKRIAASVRTEPRGLVITLSDVVLFNLHRSDLFNSAKTKLDAVAAVILRDSPGARVLVEGHTDSLGTHAQNVALSQRRAEAVASHLASRGIPRASIRTDGLGEARPIAGNTTAAGRANNRRVEIIVEK